MKRRRKVARLGFPSRERWEPEKVFKETQLPGVRAETLVRTRYALQLVPYFADEFPARPGVFLALDTLRRASVNNSQDAAPQLRLRQDHLNGVGRRAEDRADLKAVANAAQQVDRISIANYENECVARADRPGIRDRGLPQFVVVRLYPHEARTRCFIERHGEFCSGHRVHHHFVQVLRRLDEVRMPENYIRTFGYLHPRRGKFHFFILHCKYFRFFGNRQKPLEWSACRSPLS